MSAFDDLPAALAADPARRAGRRHLFGAAAACVLGATLPRRAAAQPVLESSVKAAYLFKLLPYVEWPPGAFADAAAPAVIGVLGADAVHADLVQMVAGRRVNGRPVIARKLASADVDGVHVIYVGHGGNVAHALAQLRGRPVLLVSDMPGGLAEGAVLNFVIVDGRVRFEASMPASERHGIRLSARLLAVAEKVVAQ